MAKYNYYVEQIDKALNEHDAEWPLKIKIVGSKNSSNYMTLPYELGLIIKNWYYLNGNKLNVSEGMVVKNR